jgi:hypothetical protein
MSEQTQAIYLGGQQVFGFHRNSIVGINPYTLQAPSYITSGSVLYLDAGNAASYPGTGTTWTDLSGNANNASLTANMASIYSSNNGGYFDFPFNTTYSGSVTQATSINNAYVGDFTMDIWGTIDSLISAQWTGPFGKPDQNNMAFIILIDSSNPTQVGLVRWYVNGSEYNYASKLTVTNGAWFNLQFVRSGSTLTMYQNTTSLGSVTISGNLSNSSNLTIGRPFTGNYPWNGKMSVFTVYNRALSTTELTNNYNVIRTRYGI